MLLFVFPRKRKEEMDTTFFQERQTRVRDSCEKAIKNLNTALTANKLPILYSQHVKNIGIHDLDEGPKFLRWKRMILTNSSDEYSKWLKWLLSVEDTFWNRFLVLLKRVEMGTERDWLSASLSPNWSNLEVVCVVLDKVYTELINLISTRRFCD